jgi:hypothetical protein
MSTQVLAGSSVWVSPVTLEPVTIEVVLESDQPSQALAESIQAAIQAYLSPARYNLGSLLRIRELEYVVRSTPGVNGVTRLTVDNRVIDREMSFRWSIPTLDLLTLDVVGSGVTLSYYLGPGVTNDDRT